MYKIGVIGDIASIQGFLALGLDIFPSNDKKEAADNLKNCVNGNYAIIYITEQVVHLIGDEIDKYKDEKVPAIIPIPGVLGSMGIGKGNVKKFVERAVGSDIIND